MDIINRILKLVEKYVFLLVLVAAGSLYWKFFGKSKVDDSANAAAQAEHTDHLIVPTSKSKQLPATATKAQKQAAAAVDTKAANLHLMAVYAESLHTATDHWNFQLPSTRVATIERIGKKMETYKLSLSGVAAEYKKAGYGDMLAEIKEVLTKADSMAAYIKWLGYAGKVK